MVQLYRHCKMVEPFTDIVPKFLCQELRDLISLLRELSWDWINYHDNCTLDPPQNDSSALDQIHIMWTTRGRIDYLQTAKNILGNWIIDMNIAHKLACTYCLEDEIPFSSSVLDAKKLYPKLKTNPMLCFW